MKKQTSSRRDAGALRRRAEAKLRKIKQGKTVLTPTEADPTRLVHELRVHQIELEMQNEELQHSRAQLELLLRQYTDLYDFAPVGYFTLARDSAIRRANLTGARLLGVERAQLIKRRFGLFISDETRPTFNDLLEKVIEGNRKETCEVALRSDGDEPIWVRIEATASEDEEPGTCRAIVADISARKRAEEKTSQLAAIVESSDDAIIRKTLDGIVTNWNNAAERIYGYSEGEMIGKPISILAPPDHPDEVPQILERIKFGSRVDGLETVRQGKEGRRIHMSLTISPVRNAEGRIVAASTIGRDITARKQAEEALRQSEERFRNLARALPDAIYALELPARRVTYFNHDTFLGYGRSELMAHHSILSALHPEDAPAVLAAWKRMTRGGECAPIEYRVRHKAGHWEWVQSRGVVQRRDANGRPTQILIILSTITARKQAEEELRRLSTHDALTGLYNRGFFVEEMARLERGREFPVSIVMADVDDLKATNDQQGHAAGDAMLKRAAQVLTDAFRAEDLVARVGGDEFAVLLPATDAAAARVSLQRVRQTIEENNAAHVGAPIRLSLGIGTAENPAPLSVALKEADANMYDDKRGRNK